MGNMHFPYISDNQRDCAVEDYSMCNVFFGKMNNPEQVSERVYRTTDKSFFGSIQAGDYAFIKLEGETAPASVKRLWKLREINETDDLYIASFDEVCCFDPIELLRFEALDLFVLDMNLLNKCNKMTRSLSFIYLTLTNEPFFSNLVSDPNKLIEYLRDNSHFRSVVKLENEANLEENSQNVQLYRDGDNWCLANADFVSSELMTRFNSAQYDLFERFGNRESNSAKCKFYQFLSGRDIDVSLMGLWDLFCGTVVENPDTQRGRRVQITRRDNFIDYCKTNGVATAASGYESGIRTLESELETNIDEEFDHDRCETLLTRIGEYISHIEESEIGNRINWASFVNKYVQYKDYLASKEKEEPTEEEIITAYDYSSAKHSGINKVFYGTPGCGKSYYLENVVLVQEGIDIENNVFRTVFFQDYSNTDFIGQILPKIEEDGKVTYSFNPGPFSLALKCAIDNPEEKVALVIEELNRGNAPSILGEILQLLDRKNGESIYKIINVNVQDYLKRESRYELNYIKIPSNLYIYATMNTSDQNVFTLDTAFKRRWKFEKISNILTSEPIGAKYVPGLQNITWKVFVETINDFIINHATSLSAEDKQLGKYFVNEELLMNNADDYSEENLKEFTYKVFEYLWADVAKFNRIDWFISDIKSLDQLIYKYMNHEDVFVPELANALKIYVQEDEES